MNAFWSYFWPVLAFGVPVGAIVATVAFRRKTAGWRKWGLFGLGIAIAIAGGLVWSGPLGAGERFIATVERTATATLHYYEIPAVHARLGRGPLTRQLILEGPADDFQRSELVRIMSALPGVSNATWTAGAGALPLVIQNALAAIAGFLFGLLLAYLVELHRRHNAQWNW